MSGRARARTQAEIRRFLSIGAVQIAELDLAAGGDEAVLGPGPGSPPVTHGEVFLLVRRAGRPVGTLLTRVPEGADPRTVLTRAARQGFPESTRPTGPDAARDAAASRDTGAGAARGTAPRAPRELSADAIRNTPRQATRNADALPARNASEQTVPDAGEQAVPDAGEQAVPDAGEQAVPDAGVSSGTSRGGAGRAVDGGGPPYVSVVVATRERAGQLARALDSLLAQEHPRFEVVVVDNAPLSGDTRDLVERKYGERVRYVCEPAPGLAIAHNRGLAASRGEVIAFTDDDVVADPRWLTELTAPFAADPRLGCATGLILPARLRTPAQVLLESHGGFAKGFTPTTYDPQDPPRDEPLFPFTAGRFGSGANMAFRADVLRAVGGFDPATGAGTPARGGDDLYGFVRVLAEGHRLHYTPYALVWHHHRETWADLERQAYGYGAGLTACLTAVLVNRPALLPAFLARLPRGLAHARALTAVRDTDGGGGTPGAHDTRTHPWPRRLSRLQRTGMLHGPAGYLRARRALRNGAGRGTR